MRVLVVDDSKAMRLIVKKTMREAGFAAIEVVEKVNGKEALDWLQVESPDFVLSDWNMPEMTGIELLRKLKEAGSKINFGFVTSEGSPDMRSEAAAAGAVFLIVKPFTPDDFQKALSPYLLG